MQTSETLQNLGACVERSIYRTTVYAVRRNWPGTELPDAFGIHIRTVQTVVSQRPGGVVQITCSVMARKKHQDSTQHFRYQRVPGGGYVHKGDTIPKV